MLPVLLFACQGIAIHVPPTAAPPEDTAAPVEVPVDSGEPPDRAGPPTVWVDLSRPYPTEPGQATICDHDAQRFVFDSCAGCTRVVDLVAENDGPGSPVLRVFSESFRVLASNQGGFVFDDSEATTDPRYFLEVTPIAGYCGGYHFTVSDL